jgi:nanoRNase/pAp phosphatase (c-di-AMP/oligoRNAs hydrolase)
VAERAARLREQDHAFREALLAHSRAVANVVVTDFRSVDSVPAGNRFLVFTLFPEANVGVRVQWGPGRQKVAVTGGRSIFNRTSKANVGVLMSLYGGGGHAGAGACLLSPATADAQIAEIVEALKRSG